MVCFIPTNHLAKNSTKQIERLPFKEFYVENIPGFLSNLETVEEI
jgi:hypothetical protein